MSSAERALLVVGELLAHLDCRIQPSSDGACSTGDAAPSRSVGGAAFEVATALAARGHRVGIGGAVGDDELGRWLRAELSRAGIEASLVVVAKGSRTGSLTIHPGPRFVPHRDLDVEIDVGLGSIAKALALRASASRQTTRLDLVHLASVLPSERYFARATELVEAAGALGAAASLDLNARAGLWRKTDPARFAGEIAALASRCALVKASDDDLTAVGLDALELAGSLPRSTWLLLTHGARGATLIVHGERRVLPIDEPLATHALGAGDALVARVLSAFGRDLELGRAVDVVAAAQREVVALLGARLDANRAG